MPYVSADTWRPSGIASLELAAADALKHHGAASVTAGPGAGKTEFLAQRATYLLQTGLCPAPFRILAISFKRDAAENLADRVRKRCPPDQASRFDSMTFDSFTKGLVDRFHNAIPAEWRPTRPYDVVFHKSKEVQHFILGALRSAPPAWEGEIAEVSENTFEAREVGIAKLGARGQATSGLQFLLQRWWGEHGDRRPRSALTFVLINRLAELLLRTNAQILAALRCTYPFVFVDEFQDTTYAQFDLLETAFLGSGAAITAVGDDKQRIMTWAGARVDAFEAFRRAFSAPPVALVSNYRSSPDLVRIQQVVARRIDKAAAEVTSKTVKSVAGDAAQIWTFASDDVEAAQVAKWVGGEMASRSLQSRDFGVLVRQQAEAYEPELASAFREAGLGIRNESKSLGRTTLQDLLSEELTRVAIAVARLCVQERAPASWSTAVDAVLQIRAVDPDDDLGCERVIDRELAAFVSSKRAVLGSRAPSEGSGQAFADEILKFLDLRAIARNYPQYNAGDLLAIVAEAFRIHLTACARTAKSWRDCLDEFEGAAHVPLMTVHKSKGLEYDTMIFVGLDDEAWWSYNPRNPEGLATFFVALSRAKQRAVFTFCRGRGRAKVAELYELLRGAGVPELAF